MFYVRIPRYMTTPPIRLRPVRILDGPFLSEGFKREHFLLVNNLKKPIYSSWLPVWWWIKRTFVCTYCILIDSRKIGFIGLYNFKFRKSVEISLFIFEKHIRQVKLDNHVAISFYQRNGFKELYTEGSIITMSTNLLNE
jgi:hypothetical protein